MCATLFLIKYSKNKKGGATMIENFFLFIIMSICLIILPGPDTAMATKNTLVAGKVGGVKTVFGTCIALLIHTLAAVIYSFCTYCKVSSFIFYFQVRWSSIFNLYWY